MPGIGPLPVAPLPVAPLPVPPLQQPAAAPAPAAFQATGLHQPAAPAAAPSHGGAANPYTDPASAAAAAMEAAKAAQRAAEYAAQFLRAQGGAQGLPPPADWLASVIGSPPPVTAPAQLPLVDLLGSSQPSNPQGPSDGTALPGGVEAASVLAPQQPLVQQQGHYAAKTPDEVQQVGSRSCAGLPARWPVLAGPPGVCESSAARRPLHDASALGPCS
jgi:hypothetical protein